MGGLNIHLMSCGVACQIFYNLKNLITDFQHMSDSEGDDLPLFGDKDSEDDEEVDLEEKEADLVKKQVWTGFKFQR